MTPKKKKKADFAALASPFMRINGMKVEGARALLDIGFKEIYELKGRSPEAIFEDLKKIRLNTDAAILKYIWIAVDFSEKE